jgi:hypothetical protein
MGRGGSSDAETSLYMPDQSLDRGVLGGSRGECQHDAHLCRLRDRERRRPFSPATNRIFVEFSGGGIVRGSTSVARRNRKVQSRTTLV